MGAAKKKPDLSVVIGLGKPKKGPEADPDAEAEPDEDAAHSDAMEEFSGALSAKDMPRAVEAFKVLYDLCSSEHAEGGDEAEQK